MSNYVIENRNEVRRRHYALLANQAGHWFNISPRVLNTYQSRFGEDFCLVLYRDGDDDAYVMPFSRIKSLFTEKNLMRSGQSAKRWVGSIRNGHLSIRRISDSVQVDDCHNAFHLLDQDARVAQPTPKAQDMAEPSQPDRVVQETYRILRDTDLARRAKAESQYKCQICGESLELKDGTLYVEVHHLKPLGAPHNGPDVRGNILCVCPNHHVLLDYGAIKLDAAQLKGADREYILYHNEHLFRKS